MRLNRKTRLAFMTLLFAVTFLWAGNPAYAASPGGVGFASNGSEVAFELTGPSQDMLTLTIAAPKAGYVVLTGSGYLNLTTSNPNPIYVGAVIGIGPNSASSVVGNNENDTVICNPLAQGQYCYPFSITTVIPVKKGGNQFYMVGSTFGNPATWAGINLKLTAIFADKLISE